MNERLSYSTDSCREIPYVKNYFNVKISCFGDVADENTIAQNHGLMNNEQ